MAQKCPKMHTIRQYSTVFDFKKGICFLYETNRLACFDPIRVPNTETNTEYFRIIFFNRIIRPSLVAGQFGKQMLMFKTPKLAFKMLKLALCYSSFYHVSLAVIILRH